VRWAALLAIAGCGFSPASVTATSGDAGGKDSTVYKDGPPGSTCFGTLETVCLFEPPAQAALILNAPIVTTNDAGCEPSVTDACVLFAGTITVTGAVVVTGTRPLILIATTGIAVMGAATLDASSADAVIGAAANSSACAAPTTPENGNGLLGPNGNSGGGGAGGTFGAQGSPGTQGSTLTTPKAGSIAPPAVAIDTLRGGCPGGPGGNGGTNAGGLGGASGGALYLVAGAPGSHQTIKVDGKLYAAGAKGLGGAGNSTGGGGGGSGGMIALEAETITVAGGAVIAANGGGGAGGGGAAEAGGAGGNGTTMMFTMQASGGGAGDGDAALGGKGSTIGHLSGDPGSTPNYGGGGGGGGAVGIVWTKGAISMPARFSPAPMQH
jgi:hypothetical protein